MTFEEDLVALAKRNRAKFFHLGSRQSQMFEVGALMSVVEHYARKRFAVEKRNLTDGRLFRVKLSSQGDPRNFSYFVLRRGRQVCEVHANVAVLGGHGRDAVYVVDVAVVRPGSLNRARRVGVRRKIRTVRNRDLITFVEAKRLVVYPMLLAQFLGVVHEIMPASMAAGSARRRRTHFSPALVAMGRLSENCYAILADFERRGLDVAVTTSLVDRLALISRDSTAKPISTLAEELASAMLTHSGAP